jgi:hypothetical protein
VIPARAGRPEAEKLFRPDPLSRLRLAAASTGVARLGPNRPGTLPQRGGWTPALPGRPRHCYVVSGLGCLRGLYREELGKSALRRGENSRPCNSQPEAIVDWAGTGVPAGTALAPRGLRRCRSRGYGGSDRGMAIIAFTRDSYNGVASGQASAKLHY